MPFGFSFSAAKKAAEDAANAAKKAAEGLVFLGWSRALFYRFLPFPEAKGLC